MSNFQESGINFNFQDADWTTVKYDEHVAHRKVEKVLKPTKAVDFMGIHQGNRLFLIEIKNANSRTDFLRNFFVSENFFSKPLDRSDYTCKMRILFERTRE